MRQNLLAYGLCCYTHFDYREKKRVCNKRAADNLCKTKWRQQYHDFGNLYHGRPKKVGVDSLGMGTRLGFHNKLHITFYEKTLPPKQQQM